jgi:hypothetical protein
MFECTKSFDKTPRATENHMRRPRTPVKAARQISVPTKATKSSCHTIQPITLLLLLAFFTLVSPVAAHFEAHADDHGPPIAALLLAGQYVAVMSGTLIGPAMGASSILWLMMRNDPAIDPKPTWT